MRATPGLPCNSPRSNYQHQVSTWGHFRTPGNDVTEAWTPGSRSLAWRWSDPCARCPGPAKGSTLDRPGGAVRFLDVPAQETVTH